MPVIMMLWDALLKRHSDLFARPISYAAYTGTNHMIMTGRWYHVSSATDPNSVYVCRCPSALKACYTSISKRRGTLRAPQGDYPVGSHDVRRLVLLICCSAPACPPNKSFTTASSRIVLSDGSSDQRLILRLFERHRRETPPRTIQRS